MCFLIWLSLRVLDFPAIQNYIMFRPQCLPQQKETGRPCHNVTVASLFAMGEILASKLMNSFINSPVFSEANIPFPA